jgi:peptide-methionine (S)-S-oxide reductase
MDFTVLILCLGRIYFCVLCYHFYYFFNCKFLTARHRAKLPVACIDERSKPFVGSFIFERHICVDVWLFERMFMKSVLSVLLFSVSLFSASLLADETVLAGGCFWCMESDFEKLDGVSDVVSGFTGGTTPNPTYNGDHSGHYEAVKITYDANIVSYQQILDHYWVNIDPFDDRGQFCDKGHSYLSAIFVANEQEQAIAEKTKAAVQAEFAGKKVVTPILAAQRFYPIQGDEIAHQDFYKKSPVRYNLYRWNCGRDKRLEEIWGDRASH